MCVIIRKYHSRSCTGYKVAALLTNGKVYSPATGMLYSVGKVKRIKKSTRISTSFIRCFNTDDLLNVRDSIVEPDYYGKTSVFIHEEDAVHFKESISVNDYPIEPAFKEKFVRFVIVKIRISGNLHEGIYGYCPIVAGESIRDIIILD
jgi:hypothetical protein